MCRINAGIILIASIDIGEAFQLNSSPPGQNDRYLADDVFRCILGNENICALIKISLKLAYKGPIDKNQAE